MSPLRTLTRLAAIALCSLALAGVQAGDVLVGINGIAVKSVDQVREAVAKAGKSVALLIERDGSKIFVPVRIG